MHLKMPKLLSQPVRLTGQYGKEQLDLYVIGAELVSHDFGASLGQHRCLNLLFVDTDGYPTGMRMLLPLSYVTSIAPIRPNPELPEDLPGKNDVLAVVPDATPAIRAMTESHIAAALAAQQGPQS
jgi:hypothetical protein